MKRADKSSTIGFAMLLGQIVVEGTDLEMWYIKEVEMENSFEVSSTKGYQKFLPTIDKALKCVRERIIITESEKKDNEFQYRKSFGR